MKPRSILLAIVAVTLLGWLAVRVWGPRPERAMSTSVPATAAGSTTTLPQPTRGGTPPSGPEARMDLPADEIQNTRMPTSATSVDPYSLVSQESLLAYVEKLTAIQPYSGWRNSASSGEAEALSYVDSVLRDFGFLQSLGMELERESFRVFMATELRETALWLTVDGQDAPVEVPADGLRGPRDELPQALRFDSDGVLNDSTPNPRVVEGAAVTVRSTRDIEALNRSDLRGKVVLMDYAAIDQIVLWNTEQAVQAITDLLSKEVAGLVLVTTFSNEPGESHGAFVGDQSALNWVETGIGTPALYVRLEDLYPAGIKMWKDLDRIESARLVWDADLFSPAESGNLIARIPGADSTRAMILGAHIDSPNSPGALDDGSGSAILLETARVLNESRTQPPTDLYLAWFGSEELGLYGSGHFVSTHQELLDRTQAMLQVDMLSRPLDGVNADITLVGWSYARLGDSRQLWTEYLSSIAAERGIEAVTEDLPYAYSDNTSFGGFQVPNADLIHVDEEAMEATGSLHYAAHIHDPYDTVDLVMEMAAVFEQMAQVALVAVLEVPADLAALREPPPPQYRALFVGSHTEAPQMSPAGFSELGMALAMEGYDVDLVPYGQPLEPTDLEGTELVVVLPVLDYPGPGSGSSAYDEAWTPVETAALAAYADQGGLLVLTNSALRLKLGGRTFEANEDWSDMNDLAARFGITYGEGTMGAGEATIQAAHPLVDGIEALALVKGNGVPFSMPAQADGQVLALAGDDPAVALLNVGQAGGQVLILADLGILAADWGGPDQLAFWRNLARLAKP